MASGPLTPPEAVALLCEGFPGVEAEVSHGSPSWTVDGRSFASLRVNHHGDGRVALLLALPDGRASDLVAADPEVFHRPAYTRGDRWVGVELQVADWNEVCALVADAWRAAAGAEPAVPAPAVPAPRRLQPEEIDPLRSERGEARLDGLRRICLPLPEVTEARQFGMPSFRAGRKGFCTLHVHGGRFAVQAWVGEAGQAALSGDPRFRVPPYVGAHGWIELAVHDAVAWEEVERLVVGSYRHFALKRMLAALDAR